MPKSTQLPIQGAGDLPQVLLDIWVPHPICIDTSHHLMEANYLISSFRSLPEAHEYTVGNGWDIKALPSTSVLSQPWWSGPTKQIFPSLLNGTPRYLNSVTWDSNSPFNQRKQSTVFWRRQHGSDLELLTHTPYVSHLAATCLVLSESCSLIKPTDFFLLKMTY